MELQDVRVGMILKGSFPPHTHERYRVLGVDQDVVATNALDASDTLLHHMLWWNCEPAEDPFVDWARKVREEGATK